MAAKTPAPRKPKASVGGSFGDARQIPDRYLFGTPEEVSNRRDTGYDTPPQSAVPSFQQIRPGPTAKNANEPDPAHYSGDAKYGSPRRYA